MKHRLHERRTAVFLVLLIVALFVAGALAAGLARMFALRQRAQQMYERHTQAAALAHAGVERAAARLHRDADYIGETWSVTADDLRGGDTASVTIVVSAIEGSPNQRKITATALLGEGDDATGHTRDTQLTTQAISP